jgi:hypothetical protein
MYIRDLYIDIVQIFIASHAVRTRCRVRDPVAGHSRLRACRGHACEHWRLGSWMPSAGGRT